MNRRDFIQAFGASAALTAVPNAMGAMRTLAGESKIHWEAGWRSVGETQFSPLEMTIHGKIPDDLVGSFYRNGPALSERAGLRSNHWFDGDGMVQKFLIESGKITHQGKMVQTERFVKEEKAQRFMYQMAGTDSDTFEAGRNNDTGNQANIALLPWNDELLALWEGGSAYRVDPNSLDTLGRKDWSQDLVHMPFSAHPHPDKNGRLWNFGYAPYAGKTGMLFIYDMSPSKGIERVQPVQLPMAGYIHDFAHSEQHLIFLVPPYHYKHNGGKTYVSRFEWQPELGSRLLLIDKNDLSKQQWFELPAGFVFHFGNAWQQGHEVGVNLCWYQDPSLMQRTRQEMIDDKHRPLSEQAKVSTIYANINTGKVSMTSSGTVMEFPMFNQTAFNRQDSLLGVGVLEKFGNRTEALTDYNPTTEQSKHYRYPDHVIAEEPMPVNTRTGKQYVLQTFVDLKKQQTGLNIFNRAAIDAGPIAMAEMERLVPLGFHGAFINS